MNENWILLNTYQDLQYAEIMKGVLEERGIKAVVLNKKDSAYGTFGAAELYCHVNQGHEALQILEALNNE